MSIEPIKVRVTGVNFVYTEDGSDLSEVLANFSTTDNKQMVYASGQISVTKEEYFGNPSLVALAAIVKDKFIDRLNADEAVGTVEA